MAHTRQDKPEEEGELRDLLEVEHQLAAIEKAIGAQEPNASAAVEKREGARHERALFLLPALTGAPAAFSSLTTTLLATWQGEKHVITGTVNSADVVDATRKQYDWVFYVGAARRDGWELSDGLMSIAQIIACMQAADAACVVLNVSPDGIIGLEIHRESNANVLFATEERDIDDALQAIIVFVGRYQRAGYASAMAFLRERAGAHVYFLPAKGLNSAEIENLIERITLLEKQRDTKSQSGFSRNHRIIYIVTVALILANIIISILQFIFGSSGS